MSPLVLNGTTPTSPATNLDNKYLSDIINKFESIKTVIQAYTNQTYISANHALRLGLKQNEVIDSLSRHVQNIVRANSAIYRIFENVTKPVDSQFINVKIHTLEQILSLLSNYTEQTVRYQKITANLHDYFKPEFLDEVYRANLDEANKLLSSTEEGRRFKRELNECRWFNLICIVSKLLSYVINGLMKVVSYLLEGLGVLIVDSCKVVGGLLLDSLGPALVELTKFFSALLLEAAVPIITWIIEFIIAIIPDTEVLTPFVTKIFAKLRNLVVRTLITLDNQFYLSEYALLYSYLLLKLRYKTIVFLTITFVSLFTGVTRSYPSIVVSLIQAFSDFNVTDNIYLRPEIPDVPFSIDKVDL